MSMRMEDFGELGYGLGVMGAEWWDEKRMAEGTLLPTDTWKKASLYAYFGIGGAATAMSAFDFMPQYRTWAEHISHGFIYDFPRFVRKMVKEMGGTATRGRTSSDVVRQANEVIRQRASANLLTAGRRADRSYQEEFNVVNPHAF